MKKTTNDHTPLIQEFVLRKEQILNFEMRQFILLFALEALFILFYVFGQERLSGDKHLSVVALSAFLALFFELISINGKMGLTSLYLKQLESYLASLGYERVIWETKAIDQIIFVKGNAFTLPAGLTIGMLVLQLAYSLHFTVSTYTSSGMMAFILSTCFLSVIIFIMIKTLSVDFKRDVPQVFPKSL